jgi:hypothetical protein
MLEHCFGSSFSEGYKPKQHSRTFFFSVTNITHPNQLSGNSTHSRTCLFRKMALCVYVYIYKVKQSRYMPWRRLGGEEVLLLLIHDLGTRWGWVVSITPRPCFYSRGKDPRYPLDRRLGGPQSRSGLEAQNWNCLCYCSNSNNARSIPLYYSCQQCLGGGGAGYFAHLWLLR